ncbi:MAG: hypothetical protein Q9167_000422 [Letrouitia subvulpina]
MPPTTQYAKLVREYSRRELTYDSDAMNAFKGVPELGTPLGLARVLDPADRLSQLQLGQMGGRSPLSKITRRVHIPGVAERLLLDKVQQAKLDSIDVPFLDFETLHVLFKLGDALPASTETEETDKGHQREQASLRRRWLLDSRGKTCGYINIDDLASRLPFANDVVVLVILSVAQPSDLNRFEDAKTAYSSEDEGDSILPTALEGQDGESKVANETTKSPWTVIQPSPKAGTKTNDHGWGYISEKDSGFLNFDFYNVIKTINA